MSTDPHPWTARLVLTDLALLAGLCLAVPLLAPFIAYDLWTSPRTEE